VSGYLAFEYTDCEVVDAILSAIETAGHAYHHTEQWDDENGGESVSSVIEKAAAAAATRIAELEAEVGRLKAKVRKMHRDHRRDLDNMELQGP